MGYKAISLRRREKKFQPSLFRSRDDTFEVWNWNGEFQHSCPCPLQEQITVLRFLTLKDISDDAKGEILLLTRYLLDFLRKCGFRILIDSFAKKANIDEEQPLDGSYKEYRGLWLEGPIKKTYWNFFCHKKLQALREQQPLRADQSSLEQSYKRVHLFPQQAMIPRLTMILCSILGNIISIYLSRTGFRVVSSPKTDEQQPPHGSQSGSTSSDLESIASRVKKRRRCSDENVNIEG